MRLIGQDRFRMRKKYQKPMNKNKCWGKGKKKKWKEHEFEKKSILCKKLGQAEVSRSTQKEEKKKR